MNIIHQTDRLYFREFTTADAPLIYQLNSNPEVTKYVHELPTTDEETALTVITNRILPQYRHYGYGRWAVHLRNDHAFIGWCGLKYRPERAETDLGYRFMPAAWGQGYATEAAIASLAFGFGSYQLSHIAAMAHRENLASIRVLEKVGMQFIGYETVDACPVKTYRLANPQLPPS
jgi:ribosomal-protein-alanine N-acetyltransferase